MRRKLNLFGVKKLANLSNVFRLFWYAYGELSFKIK